jgi:tetratricopeptide (TPR) repeat protein
MARRLLATVGLVVALAGCASVSPPTVGIPRSEEPYLLPPYEGWNGSLSAESARRLQELYLGLMERGEVLAALEGSQVLLAADPGLLPAQVLAGQAALAARRNLETLEMLEPVLERAPGYVSAWVLYARAAELEGWIVESYAAYEAVRGRSRVAAEAADSLRQEAVLQLADRFDEQFNDGDLAGASRSLETLQAWAPEDELTVAAAEALGEASADPAEQLALLRRMTAEGDASSEVMRRRAELELQVGDPAAAVRLAETLLESRPNDLYLGQLLARSRFQWRLNLLPTEVRTLGRSVELSRADYAVLMYWLFPQVRYGRPTEATIATDIIDHPNQEAIVKVINLGLLEVDSTVHHFEPDTSIGRREVLGSLLSLLEDHEGGDACLAPGGVPESDDYRCQAAVACRLVTEVAECLPGATVSGGEAIELARRTLTRLGTD